MEDAGASGASGEQPGLNLFSNFQFLCGAALPFKLPSRRIIVHERKGVPIWIFETGIHSAPALCLRWTKKTDPALGPLLKIGHNIFGNENNVPGAANELVFLRAWLWSDEHKHCRAIRRSDRYPTPDGNMGISEQIESELVQVESQASIHIGNEDDKGVNTEVGPVAPGEKATRSAPGVEESCPSA
jgi:hypothetical protein